MKAKFSKDNEIVELSEADVTLLRGALHNEIVNTQESIARVGAKNTYQHTILDMYEQLLKKLGGEIKS